MTEPPADTGRRLVWAGRSSGGGPGALDGWTVSDDALLAALRRADELVLLDPVSFPWRVLAGARRSIPLVVRVPAELGIDDLVTLLGRPLFRHVTRWERLVEARPEVRAELTARYRLPPDVWVDADPADPAGIVRDVRAEAGALGRKAVFRQAARLVADEVLPLLAEEVVADDGADASVADGDAPADTRTGAVRVRPVGTVGFVGRAALLATHVERIAGATVRVHPEVDEVPVGGVGGVGGVGAEELAPPSPDVVVVWLDDGGQSARHRARVLGGALSLLHPGGRLMLLGYVVDEPGRAGNPRISALVEELAAVSGTLVHIDDLRSVRWESEPLTRGVLLTATHLRTGRI